MGKFTFRLPDIGEGIAEAEVIAWHVKLGDRVEEDAPLADVMTDKATVELESPVAGVVVALAGEAGDRLAIGSPLVVFEVEGEGEGEESAAPVAPARTEQVEAPVDAAPRLPVPPGPVEGRAPQRRHSGKALAAPAVRARAQALGIDLARVAVGPSGRVTHADLDAVLRKAAPARSAPDPVASAETPPVKPDVQIPGPAEPIKVIGLRRKIAENMAAAKRHIPHFTYVEECDVTALEALRVELNEGRANGQAGVRPKLTLLPLFITALCRAVPQFPMINARYDDQAGVVTRYGAVHLGMAVQTDNGLMVPVIRDADSRSVWTLADEIARLAAACRDGTVAVEDLTGGTLTVTSLGPLGGVASTPVINRPEVAIIGPNRIIERAVFVPDEQGGERIEKRKLMNVSISCDHRVVDGWDAASFVQAIRRLLENPLALLAG
jgi:2-oxoisovalerate dehydrogenase E2 component (dihydrolipoyl transacylase)